MDYAFVPGITTYEKNMQQLLTNRPNTTLIQKHQNRTITYVAAFFTHLKTDDNIAKPVGNLGSKIK